MTRGDRRIIVMMFRILLVVLIASANNETVNDIIGAYSDSLTHISRWAEREN